jgi:hypothetical protein
MSTDNNARIAGILFITATVAAVISGVFLESLSDPDYLVLVSANKNDVLTGVLLDFTCALAVVAIPVMLYPILKQYNETLALGYIGTRILESVILVVGDISNLSLLSLSQEYVLASAPDDSFQILGTLLQATYDWTFLLGPGIVFSITALILNYILYKSKLIPRWLSGWGLFGATSLLVGDMLAIFGYDQVMLFAVPIGLQEMVFAVWLIVKGFNPTSITSLNANTELNEVD